MISKISHKEFMSATYLKPASLHVELQNGNGLKHKSIRCADERSLTKVIESIRLLQKYTGSLCNKSCSTALYPRGVP